MSRIGKAPITIAKGVEVNFNSGVVTVKGPKGELTQPIDPAITLEIEGETITLSTQKVRHEVILEYGYPISRVRLKELFG